MQEVFFGGERVNEFSALKTRGIQKLQEPLRRKSCYSEDFGTKT